MSNLTFPDTCGVPLNEYGKKLAAYICKRLEISEDEVKTDRQFMAASAYLKALHPEDGPGDEDEDDANDETAAVSG